MGILNKELSIMNYIATLLTMGAVFVLALFGYAGYSSLKFKSDEKIIKTKKAASTILRPQINTQGLVSVTVIPPAVMQEFQAWVFGVTLDTHSVDLKEDVRNSSFLVDDKGKLYKPTLWQGDRVGGHHRNGSLVFDPIIPKPASIEFVIKKIGGIEKRSFKWTL